MQQVVQCWRINKTLHVLRAVKNWILQCILHTSFKLNHARTSEITSMYVILTHSYNIVILSHSTGTKTGMERLPIPDRGTTWVYVEWGEPKYTPLYYALRYQCSLMCENEPYLEMRRVYRPPLVAANYTYLKPASKCKLNFVATYNTAELDPGVDYVFETPHSSKADTYRIAGNFHQEKISPNLSQQCCTKFSQNFFSNTPKFCLEQFQPFAYAVSMLWGGGRRRVWRESVEFATITYIWMCETVPL